MVAQKATVSTTRHSLVPSVDVHTKNTSAGAMAARVAWRPNASQSAIAAIVQTAEHREQDGAVGRGRRRGRSCAAAPIRR